MAIHTLLTSPFDMEIHTLFTSPVDMAIHILFTSPVHMVIDMVTMFTWQYILCLHCNTYSVDMAIHTLLT